MAPLLPSTAAAQTPEEPHEFQIKKLLKAPEPEPEPQPASAPPDEKDANALSPRHEEAAESEPIANANPESGPPAALLASEPPASDASGAPSAPSGYVKKDNKPYMDVFSAWGWSNNSYLMTFCLFNMYLRGPTSRFGFHGRLITLGALSFEQRNVRNDGTTSLERRSTVVLEVFDPGLRVYFAGPVFWAFNVDFGMAFYDSLVPTLDLQSGLGFDYQGWGIEVGARTSRLPHDQVIVNDDKFVREKYGLLVYLALETNIHL